MRSHLVIIHRPLGEGSAKPFVPVTHGAIWSTCLRSIAFGGANLYADQIQSGDQVLEGCEAYEFLLQVVCGLHSPVKGETEVHGQYKKFLEEAKERLSREEYRVLHDVHVDAKRVRTLHLRHLGSQSYGSFCRRQVRGLGEVNLIGSGHLVRELLPWLAKSEATLRVFCRSAAAKREEFQSRFPNVQVEELYSAPISAGSAVVVAAPVRAHELSQWMAPNRPRVIIDLRAESAEDPLPMENFSLKDVFQAIEASRAKINSEVEKARQMVKELAYANQNLRTQKRSREAASLSGRTSA